jgi:hypothetical protein
MAKEMTPHEWLSEGKDRRRIPRYICCGEAQIAFLPSGGTFLRGQVRDLGLGGCRIECIETPSELDLGTRTEILVEVNSWFFRAMAHVRAIRGRRGVSMEFMRMSAGGHSRLADLVADLARPQAFVGRQKHLLEHSRQLLRSNSGLVLSDSVALVGTIVPACATDEASLVVNRRAWLRNLRPGTTSVDIFV